MGLTRHLPYRRPMLDGMRDLGPLVQECGRSRAYVRMVFKIVAACAVVSAILFATAIGARGSTGNKIGVSGLATVPALLALYGVYRLKVGGPAISLHEGGLVYRYEGKVVSAAWDEIASYTEHALVRVAKKNGEAFEFGAGVDGFGALAERLQQETLDRVLSEVRASVEAGRRYVFKGLLADDGLLGAFAQDALRERLVPEGLAVDARGITDVARGVTIAWSEVEEGGVVEGEDRPWRGVSFLFIRGGGRAIETLYGGLPNAHVLGAFVAEKTNGPELDAPVSRDPQ